MERWDLARQHSLLLRLVAVVMMTTVHSFISSRGASAWINVPSMKRQFASRLTRSSIHFNMPRSYHFCPERIRNGRNVIPIFQRRRNNWSSSSLFMSSGDDEDDENEPSKSLESKWNVPGLKKEVQRSILRCHKKIGKASERLDKARQTVTALTDPASQASLEELEDCPNVQLLEIDLSELQFRLRDLNTIEEQLGAIKKKEAVLPRELAALALNHGIDDKPPARPPRGAPKPKGPSGGSIGPRKPYRCYYSLDKTEIRVGKRATDNDDLTMNPEHRDNANWWMHASGCPGSHVVIRNTSDNLPPDVVLDAAALAARQSKCHGSVIKVSLARCRDIKKPPGAKAGLVMLTGNVRTVSVNMKEAEKRLARLDETLVIN